MSRPLPVNLDEARSRGWSELDIVLVSGDAYIDHPAFGVPLLARVLEKAGFRVGIIPQPDWRSKEAFMALGRPRLFFGVSAGAMDSMVAHYTPQKKLRHDDAYTPGNRHGARPNRATIIYTSRIKEAYRDTPIVIGGIEASLRRLAHYDFWEDKVRRSILPDSKADMLIFGMAEKQITELARRMKAGGKIEDITNISGTAFMSRSLPSGAVEIPSYEQVSSEKELFSRAFILSEQEQNPYSARPLAQGHGDRWLVCNPPSLPLSEKEMDALYALPFSREPHPSCKEQIPAFEQIKNSITTHRGCFGGCSFCAIANHQGKFIQSRSIASIKSEIGELSVKKYFKGQVSDLGGPTANMYGLSCGSPDNGNGCRRPACLYPSICPNLKISDSSAVDMLKQVRSMKEVRDVFVSSGIRYDLLEQQPLYFSELVAHHVGGLLKVAPEHFSDDVTAIMRKPESAVFERFLCRFREENRRLGKRLAVVPYLMSGHPGCTVDMMVDLAQSLNRLRMKVEQVQEFTPTPGTASTSIYYTGLDPSTLKPVYVARSDSERRLQKCMLLWHLPEERAKGRKMLIEKGRNDLLKRLEGINGNETAVRNTSRGQQKKRTPR